MSKVTAEEQVAFLLSCIRFSNNGKVSHHPQAPSWSKIPTSLQVDFTEVAKECSIVTPAAAYVDTPFFLTNHPHDSLLTTA
jgi:hypothetical protein